MSVVIDAPESKSLNDAFIEGVKKDPKKAIEFLVWSGQQPNKEKAAEFVDSIQTRIAISEKSDALKGYFTDTSATIRGLVDGFGDPDPLIGKMLIKVTFDRSVNTETDEPFGFMVAAVIAHDNEGDKLTGAIKTKSSGGGGGTKRARVPCPEGVKNWKAHLSENYPDDTPTNGTAFSAPRILTKLGDPTYLKAAADAGMDVE